MEHNSLEPSHIPAHIPHTGNPLFCCSVNACLFEFFFVIKVLHQLFYVGNGSVQSIAEIQPLIFGCFTADGVQGQCSDCTKRLLLLFFFVVVQKNESE